ncbi:hypothetical protein POTOM_062126 [Populus tomentosa]|uniref:Uncharacterized protein n=1 Tax=Populus tomentosa TaxID=118781 RepID=A0A8X7XNC7_POPTO|nr:hypothetical protein POTOM_062126 [Populus tomentosa]
MGTVNKDEILKEVGKEWDESGGEESFDISEISFDISRLLDSPDLGVLAIGLGRIDILRGANFVGIDSLGMDVRIFSGVEARTHRFPFKVRATCEVAAQKQMHQLLFPRSRRKKFISNEDELGDSKS